MVVEVASDTVNLLRDTVLTSIHEEHTENEELLNRAYAPFATLQGQLDAGTAAITELAEEVRQRSADHMACRSLESGACAAYQQCDGERTQLREVMEADESVLTSIDTEIHAAWCSDGSDRTQHEFRSESRNKFTRYNDALGNLEIATSNFDNKNVECIAKEALQTNNRTECDRMQQQLEQVSCAHGNTQTEHTAAYHEEFAQAAANFDTVKEGARLMEADRKVEFTTLNQVICLLAALTNDQDGAASSAATTAEIERCHNLEVDTTALDLTYLDTPTPGAFPEVPVVPCSDAYIAQEYGSMPSCTAHAACIPCAALHAEQD
jgi:hypothetical protein